MAVSNWTGHERVSFFRHAEYKQTCSRQTTKKERLNALMLLNKNLLWPSQMENVNRNNVKKLKSNFWGTKYEPKDMGAFGKRRNGVNVY